MSLVFERVITEGIAEMSYLVGDSSKGVAAVIDPRCDVEVYLRLARKNKVSITHVFETHIHADLVSGSRELAAQSGTAVVHGSVEGGASYAFPVQPVRDGDRFEFGDIALVARHTPGHTPEHMSYEVYEDSDKPWGVFSGDALFVNSAGRPDLLGRDADILASQLYDTLFGYFAKLGDGVIIYPSHGSGSPCGADIGDRTESTIGEERRANPYFQKTDRAEFVDYALSTAPPEPTYYQRMKRLNAEGPPVLGHLPVIPALSHDAFKLALDSGQSILIDTRDNFAFAGGHIAGAINIGGAPLLTVWAGWLIDPASPILLVLDDDADVPDIAALFVRSGYSNFTGYIAGGQRAWNNAGHEVVGLPQMSVHDVSRQLDDLQVLDVRSPSEWKGGRIAGSIPMFVPEIRARFQEIDKSRPVVTYCAAGYRSSLAASILQQLGFADVRAMSGNWPAWKSAGLPVTS